MIKYNHRPLDGDVRIRRCYALFPVTVVFPPHERTNGTLWLDYYWEVSYLTMACYDLPERWVSSGNYLTQEAAFEAAERSLRSVNIPPRIHKEERTPERDKDYRIVETYAGDKMSYFHFEWIKGRK